MSDETPLTPAAVDAVRLLTPAGIASLLAALQVRLDHLRQVESTLQAKMIKLGAVYRTIKDEREQCDRAMQEVDRLGRMMAGETSPTTPF